MGKLKAQVSPDYAVSAFIFSIVVLFLFSSISRTYYSKAWEMERAEKTLEALKLANFLVGDEGNWSSNPLTSKSLAFGGKEINETKLRWFVGMPYPHVVNKTGLRGDFKIEINELPSIAITSDVEEQYISKNGIANITIQFKTSKEADLYVVIVGGNVTYGGSYSISEHFNSTGLFHKITLYLKPGVYSLKALAIGKGYGAYEVAFKVI